MHDARPANGRGAEVDDIEDGCRGRKRGGRVEDVLVGADTAGCAEGPRGDAVGTIGGGEAAVGFVVGPWGSG